MQKGANDAPSIIGGANETLLLLSETPPRVTEYFKPLFWGFLF